MIAVSSEPVVLPGLPRAGTPSSNTSRKPSAYCRATRSRSAARAMTSRSDQVGSAFTSCSATWPSPPGAARRIASYTSRASSHVQAVEHALHAAPQVLARRHRGQRRSSRTMPRFVFVAATRRVARTAIENRFADAAAAARCPAPGAMAAALSRKSTIGRVVEVAEAMDVARLARSPPTGRRAGRTSRVDGLAGSPVTYPLVPGSRTISAATSTPVTGAQRSPARHRVHLEHVPLAVRPRQQIDAGDRGADRRGRRSGPAAPPRAPMPTGSPVPPWATLVRQSPRAWRRIAVSTRPPSTKTRRSQPGMADELLQVQHGSACRSSVRKVRQASSGSRDAHHAAALGAEQRLDDDVAAEGRERLQGGVGVLADDRRRHRQAGGLEPARWPGTCPRTISSGARRVEDAHAARPASRCSTSMRKTTCSSEPGGMVRTMTASKSSSELGPGGDGGADAAEIDGTALMAQLRRRPAAGRARASRRRPPAELCASVSLRPTCPPFCQLGRMEFQRQLVPAQAITRRPDPILPSCRASRASLSGASGTSPDRPTAQGTPHQPRALSTRGLALRCLASLFPHLFPLG